MYVKTHVWGNIHTDMDHLKIAQMVLAKFVENFRATILGLS